MGEPSAFASQNCSKQRSAGSEVNENGPSLASHDIPMIYCFDKLLFLLQGGGFKEERNPFEDVTSLMSFCTAVAVYASIPMIAHPQQRRVLKRPWNKRDHKKWLCIQYNKMIIGIRVIVNFRCCGYCMLIVYPYHDHSFHLSMYTNINKQPNVVDHAYESAYAKLVRLQFLLAEVRALQ